MQLTVAIFERRTAHGLECTALGLGEHAVRRSGKGDHKVNQRLAQGLKELAEKEEPRNVK